MISWRVRPSLPWCFGVAEGCFQHRIQYNGKSWEKATFYRVSEGTLESFLFVVCPSFPAMVFLVRRRAVFSTGFINGYRLGNVFLIQLQKGR